MQNPEEVSFQLDTLMSEVEETQHSMEALDETLGMNALTELDLEAFEASPAGEIGKAEDRIDAGLLDDLDDVLGDATDTEAAARRRAREG